MIAIEPQHKGALVLDRLLLDPWLAMLCLGALGHRLDIPYLLTLGFWDVWLAVFALWCLIPTVSEFKQITWRK